MEWDFLWSSLCSRNIFLGRFCGLIGFFHWLLCPQGLLNLVGILEKSPLWYPTVHHRDGRIEKTRRWTDERGRTRLNGSGTWPRTEPLSPCPTEGCSRCRLWSRLWTTDDMTEGHGLGLGRGREVVGTRRGKQEWNWDCRTVGRRDGGGHNDRAVHNSYPRDQTWWCRPSKTERFLLPLTVRYTFSF